MYTIIYQEEVENTIRSELCVSKEHEVAILATAKRAGETICIDGVLSVLKDGQTDIAAYIEPETQLKFMKYCENRKKMPVVIHTHLYADKHVSFSCGDLKFIEAFQTVQNKMDCEKNSLFLVYGANQVAAELMLDGKIKPAVITDTIHFKGER